MYNAVAGGILTVGGSPDYQNSYATSNAHVITIGNPGSYPTVTTINSMSFARAFANGIVLPDGTVFIIGGQTYAMHFKDTNAILTPELWDPKTTKFFKMAPNNTSRTYHSVGLLMPDGTVFSRGGGLCGSCSTNHFDGQFYSPPYLFLSDGVTLAPRPVISSLSTSTVKVGASITITMQSTVSSFSVIRMGATTHAVNTDRRRIPLTPTVKGLECTVWVPGDAGVAVPGYWMSFAMDGNRVPSYAKTVLVTL
jgi:galactose oxidase